MVEPKPDVPVPDLSIDRSRRRLPSRRGRQIALAALLLGLALIAFALAARAPTVAVAEVRQAAPGEAATELTAAGFVAAERRSIVSPKAAGRLDTVYVAEGDRVGDGQVIAQMDSRDATIAVQQTESSVGVAQATLAASESQALQAQRTLDRSQKLEQIGAISREALLDALAARDTARAQQSAAEARLQEARRALRAAQQRLEDTVVRAPFSGTVARKLADEGAVLAPAALSEQNMGGIVELVDLDSLYVQAEVSEDQLGRIRNGQPALIFLDAFPGRVFGAVTGTVRPTIDKAKATAIVKVHFARPDEGPLPDMGAKVSFLDRPVSDDALANDPRLRVPATAVVEREGSLVVMTVRGGRVQTQPVQVAGRVGNEVALRRGPKPGTPVVAAPGPRLHSGSKVKVRTEGAS